MNSIIGGNTLGFGLGRTVKRSSGVTPIDPGTLSGLTGRWRASSLSGADNSPLDWWNDETTNGYNLRATGGAEPKLRLTAFNGEKGVECTDYQRCMYGTPGNLISISNGFTIFTVLKIVSIGNYPSLSYSNPGVVGDPNGWWGVRVRNTPGIFGTVYDSLDRYSEITPTINQIFVHTTRYSPGILKTRINQGQDVSASNVGTLGSVGGGFHVGLYNTSTGTQIIYGEVNIYNAYLSDDNVGSGVAWLMNQYGVS